ncbi:DUF6603 domain-containing protein [Micromonospora sp. NPDC049175]|uniref:DUF6603 domain-containing protein n=1 Tax=Micromonospora sp. NPDC049175 TaxID=3364266 RepID=UPI00371F4FB7
MHDASTFERLLDTVGRALAALPENFTPKRFPQFLMELGLDGALDLSGDAVFQGKLTDASHVLDALLPALDALYDGLAAGDAELTLRAGGDVLAAVTAATGALDSVAADLTRAATSTPFAASAASLATELVPRLFEFALVGELERSHPTLLAVLELLTVVDRTVVEVGTGATAALVMRRRTHVDRLAPLVTDLQAVLRGGYGWGTESVQWDLFLWRLGQLLHAIDIAAGDLLDAETGQPALGLDLSGLTVGISTDRHPPGLAATLTASATDSATIPLSAPSPGWRVELALQGAYREGLALMLLPPARLQLAGAVPPAPGGVALKIHGAAADAGKPFVLLGIGGASRLEASTIEASIGGSFAADGSAGVTFDLQVTGGGLVLSSKGGDGFVTQVLPRELRCAFDFGISWSSERGFTFHGTAGLDATLPVGVSLDGLTVPAIHLGLQAGGPGLRAEVSASVGLSIGPVQALVDRVGMAAVVTFPTRGGNLGVADLHVGFTPPSGLALTVDAGPVTGGGALVLDPDRGVYAGEMQLQFQQIAVRAVGLLTTGPSGYSLLVLVSAQLPPVQLGLGFMLVGVGGLLGIHRTVAVEALRAGLKAGALGAVLSPPDPKADPARLMASLAGLFPPAAGRHVFAPTARIVWGSPVLITIDLALVLELPSPVRLVALGRVRALLPEESDPVVRLQVDVLGVIDFDQQSAAVDATLIDSRIAQFALTGDLALRMSWGPNPTFLLAVGGFHPRFAAPPGFPALDRVAVALASGDNPKLRLEAYLALTSNTVQFGARVDVGARAGSFSIGGFLAFDALVTLSPLAFHVDIAAKLAVKAGSHTLFSINLALTLTGPRPWHAHGRASFSILFFDVSFGFDLTVGDAAPAALPNPVDVGPLLLAALADPRSWNAQLPASADVVTLRRLEPGPAILAHPLATLQVRQRVAPLERTLDRFGAGVPSGARRFRITQATVGGVRTTLTPLPDRFAPAQFTTMSDDVKLSAPSFEAMTSGAALGADGYTTGAPVTVGVVYEQALVTAENITPPGHQRLPLPPDVFATLTAPTSAPAAAFALRDAA